MASLDQQWRQTRPGKSVDDHCKPASPVARSEAEEGRLLKDFDLNYAFGPCNGEKLYRRFSLFHLRTGITRLKRWERAKKLNLNPPEEIKEIILQHGVEYNDRCVCVCVCHFHCVIHLSVPLQYLVRAPGRNKINQATGIKNVVQLLYENSMQCTLLYQVCSSDILVSCLAISLTLSLVC